MDIKESKNEVDLLIFQFRLTEDKEEEIYGMISNKDYVKIKIHERKYFRTMGIDSQMNHIMFVGSC